MNGLRCCVLQTRADSPWTESAQSRFVVDDVVYTNSGEALDQFEHWIKYTAPDLDLPPFDQATLFTGSATGLYAPLSCYGLVKLCVYIVRTGLNWSELVDFVIPSVNYWSCAQSMQRHITSIYFVLTDCRHCSELCGIVGELEFVRCGRSFTNWQSFH